MTAQPRSLVITAESPYPPSSGVPLRNWQNINALAAFGPVDLISIGRLKPGSYIPVVERWEHVQTTADGAGVVGYPLLSDSQASLTVEAIARVLADHPADVIVFENVSLGQVPALLRSTGAVLIFDSHNVYIGVGRELGKATGRIRDLEAHQLAACDQAWVCSGAEADLIHEEYGSGASLAIVPNGIDTGFYEGVRLGAQRRLRAGPPTFAFIGAFWYEPNQLGAHWLLDEVAPLLRARLPDARLVFVGPGPSEHMLEAARRHRSVVVTGSVPDVRPYLAASDAVVAPIFQGGGTRFKVLEAFAAHRPVVTTAKGAQGLEVEDGGNVLLRESAAAFADAMLEVCEDPALARRLADAGYRLVEDRYSWRAVGAAVKAALSAFNRWDLG